MRLGQLFVDSDQLILGAEVDLDSAARALTDDAYARPEHEAQPVFGGAGVNVNGLGGRAAGASPCDRLSSATFFTSDSVSRTDKLRVITSRARRR